MRCTQVKFIDVVPSESAKPVSQITLHFSNSQTGVAFSVIGFILQPLSYSQWLPSCVFGHEHVLGLIHSPKFSHGGSQIATNHKNNLSLK